MLQPLTSDNYKVPSLLVMRVLQHDSSDTLFQFGPFVKTIITFQGFGRAAFRKHPLH